MLVACALNLLFPVIGLIVLLSTRTAEGFEPPQGFFVWFVVGALFQAVAALMLFRPKPQGWKRGWLMLWVAAAAYMGAYSDVYLQKKVVSGDLGAVYAVQTQPSKIASLDKEVGELAARVAAAPEDTALAADLARKRKELEARRDKLASGKERLQATFQSETPPAGKQAELERTEQHFGTLEYVLAFLFLTAFFSIAAFVSRTALDEYHIRDPNLEDPLAFKAEFGL